MALRKLIGVLLFDPNHQAHNRLSFLGRDCLLGGGSNRVPGDKRSMGSCIAFSDNFSEHILVAR